MAASIRASSTTWGISRCKVAGNIKNYRYVEQGGVYKLEVQNLQYHFEPVVVEIAKPEDLVGPITTEGEAKRRPLAIRAFLYSLKNGRDAKLLYPLQLEPSMRMQYFEVEAAFNPLSYLKNPMVIMVGVSGILMFMMKRMPKQELEQMQEMQ